MIRRIDDEYGAVDSWVLGGIQSDASPWIPRTVDYFSSTKIDDAYVDFPSRFGLSTNQGAAFGELYPSASRSAVVPLDPFGVLLDLSKQIEVDTGSSIIRLQVDGDPC